ncbi:arginine--tRNA ligase, chloroplastic/mitochondrial, partial [Tanacetum coccineum]
MYISPLSPSTSAEMGPSTSNIIRLSTPAPSTPIPEIYDWTHSTVTTEESGSFLIWAISTGSKMADPDASLLESGSFLIWAISTGSKMADPDASLLECTRLLKWSYSKSELAAESDPEEGGKRFVKWSRSILKMADPNEPRRKVLKWAHSTSTIRAPDFISDNGSNGKERKRWSLQEEISKPFETALKRLQEENSYTDLKQEHMLYTCQKGMHGVYECQNALWIWPRIRNSCTVTIKPIDGGPREVGKKIKEKFPESDMIKGRPSINDLGFVTIELSGKWIAKSIHKMLKDDIDTWAPKLPVERVIIDYPSLDEEMHVDLFRRRAIGYTLMSILKYFKVDVTIGHPTISPTHSKEDRAQKVLNRWFSTEERQDRYGLQRADWMVYLTPVWKQEYIGMCFTTAKLDEHAKSNTHKPARTSYAGYRSCRTELEDKLLEKVKTCVAAEQGEDAKLLGYTPEAVLDCVLMYTCLKTHRLAECKFNINDEMHKEEGNTFLYLLNTQAKIRRITDDSREDINELKKCLQQSSELILGKTEGWEKGEERMLGFRLLKFTEDWSFTDTSTLLLCEATGLVMEKCFHLLGITPTSSFFSDQTLPKASELAVTPTPLPLRLPFSTVKRPVDVNARDPRRNSRFELFSFLTRTATHLGSDKVGRVFGVISVSDKYGLLSSDGESHFFEPDFAHVPLFNHKWCDPIIPTESGLVYLGNPSSGCSVSVSSSIEVRMELYVAKNEDACYQISNHKVEIDFSDFWEEKSDSACGALTVSGEEGSTLLFYVVLKDAIDASLEVKFETKTPGRKVRGYVLAYYGDDFLAECQCQPSRKYNYMSLLFLPNHVLKAGAIQLLRSLLAVPTKGSLVIKAYLEDVNSGEVIMKNNCKFKSQPWGSSFGTISGTDCQFDLKVDWKYQAQSAESGQDTFSDRLQGDS